MHKKLMSIIIVTYKNVDCIGECLKSIFEMNDLRDGLEVIVVDNGPDDDPTGKLVQEKFPEVNYVKNAVNNGFGGGSNAGAKIAKGELLLFLNPDTIMIEPLLSWAVQKSEQNQKIGMFGVNMVDRTKKPVQSFSYLPDAFNIINLAFPKINVLRNKLNILPRRFHTMGADMFIRKELFEKVGLFDEHIFLYFEESDLVYRVMDAGYTIAYFPEKHIVHLEGQSTSDMPRQKSINYYTSLQYVISKHKSKHPRLSGKMKLILFVFQVKYMLKRSERLMEFIVDINKITKGAE